MLSRRSLIINLSTTALVGALVARSGSLLAADKTVKIGINLPFTGADANDAELIKDGAMLAFDARQRRGRRSADTRSMCCSSTTAPRPPANTIRRRRRPTRARWCRTPRWWPRSGRR